MAQLDDFNSSNAESPLKRKAISEFRLQDPKIWTKISWIRTNFIKDLESGVRKTDFYNFVTDHLGKTGYRDVWHLLKIAYPHVDRVRRGRKYMYWGIRYADDKVKFGDATDDGNGGIEDDEETYLESPFENEKEFSTEDNSLNMEAEGSPDEDSRSELADFNFEAPSRNRTGINERCGGMVVSSRRSIPHREDTTLPSSIAVKLERESDVEDQKQDEVLVIEFKDNEVFASFEDYEKSKQSDHNGNFIDTKYKKPRVDKRRNTQYREETRSIARSVSPPLEIFSFESFKDNEKKNNILDISPTSKDCHNNGDHRDPRQTTSLKQERCHGDGVNGSATLQKQENRSPTNMDWTTGNNSKIREEKSGEFVQNLLQPENINRMCMPLIKEFVKKIPNKAIPDAQTDSNVNEPSEIIGQIISNNLDRSTSAVNSSKTDSELETNEKFCCDPMIVSVASIAGMQANKHSDEPCFEEIKNILKASQFNSCKSINARVDVNVVNEKNSDVSSRQLPPSQHHSAPDSADAEFVVVQDRGIQVNEHFHTCNPMGKRGLKHVKSTVCHKPSHSSKNEHAPKKLYTLNPRNVTVGNSNRGFLKNIISNVSKSGQVAALIQAATRSKNDARVCPSGASPPSSGLRNRTPSTQQEINNSLVQPRFSVAIPRNSQSASKVMGNVVRSEEPLMKALVNKPPIYHAHVRNTSSALSSADGNTYPTGPVLQTAPKRLLPKSTFSTVVSTAANKHQVRSSIYVNSSQGVGNYTTSTIQERPTLTIPHHPQQEKQSLVENASKMSTCQLPPYNERNNGEQYSMNESALRDRELVRKLLADREAKSSSPTCTSTSDLQVTVDCLSSELEKERTMRLRLEIELRKVENQLNEERKLNQRLASLLMKR